MFKTLLFNMLHPLFIMFYERLVELAMNDQDVQTTFMNILHKINLKTGSINSTDTHLNDEQKQAIKEILVNEMSTEVKALAEELFVKVMNK